MDSPFAAIIVNSEVASTKDDRRESAYEVLDGLHYQAGHSPPNSRDFLDTLCDSKS